MSRPTSSRPLSTPKLPVGGRRASRPPLPSLPKSPILRTFQPHTTPHPQRTSKNSQKLVVLPSDPQTKSLHAEDTTHEYETDAGVREYKSTAERMNKEQRKKAGFKRITAYCIAEELRMKLLASFLKREHNVLPRVFDEALYVMYHLPLLPGYGPNVNIRSSVVPKSTDGKSVLSRLSEAEEDGYQGTYFTSPAERSPNSVPDGYITSSPVDTHRPAPPELTESEAEFPEQESPPPRVTVPPKKSEADVAEVVFFGYGVIVFFGLDESQEREILEDVGTAGITRRPIMEDDWEVEECHFVHDQNIAYPRIYNDFFTFKSRSHLLKLSVSHALAQSTLLSYYESLSTQILSSPLTLSIPLQLAKSGALNLRRHDALKLTGKLFKLRRDVNLVSNVLDIPELFWSEASLKGLYDAVREYMEIEGRVKVLNEKIGIASDFLDAIHDHLNNSAMERITWIVIWLIVVAILVELGEVIARLVVHATTVGRESGGGVIPLSKENALRILERMVVQSRKRKTLRQFNGMPPPYSGAYLSD